MSLTFFLRFIQTAPISDALQRYDAERVPATSKVVLQNRKKGPDSTMDLMGKRFPKGFTKTEIPHQELDEIMEKYKQIVGFDWETLNKMG